jgi:hypothetical protein
MGRVQGFVFTGKRLTPYLGDPHARDLYRAPTGDHALGFRRRKPETHQHGLPTSFIK